MCACVKICWVKRSDMYVIKDREESCRPRKAISICKVMGTTERLINLKKAGREGGRRR